MTRESPKLAQWIEGDVKLRSLGFLYENFAGWAMEGKKESPAATSKWKGVCGSPLFPLSQVRSYDNELLILVVPGPLRLDLSFNEILNFLEKNCWEEAKEVMQEVLGIRFHVYQGKVGNLEGPSISKILHNLEKLEPYMLGGSNLRLLYVTFLAFKDVASTAFSEQSTYCMYYIAAARFPLD